MKNNARDLFARAHELPDHERDTFLREACGDDTELRLEVMLLLAKAEKADSFFGGSESATLCADNLDAPLVEAEGDQVGPYTLRQQIGEGGFGVVWMAEQTKPISRMVALKVIKAGMDTKQVLARFEAERQALAMMDHPNIAKVLDAGSTPTGRPYVVMELVKGVPITEFCDQQRFGPHRRLELFRDVCSAVNHAHQKGVVHRDLKPSNVMVTLHGDKPVVKVIDFGIAKAMHNKLTDKTLFTRFEQFLGTPVYMSPEQAALSGLDVDTRSDIYSLGVLLYELLAGSPPFDQKSLLSAGYDEMRRIIREEDPPRPSIRLTQSRSDQSLGNSPGLRVTPNSLRGDLDWIVMKAIEKDRSRRYETAHSLSQDIERFLKSEPVLAAAPSPLYRVRKYLKRHRLGASLVSMTALALVAGAAISSWQAVRATRAESTALAAAEREKSARTAEEEQRKEAQGERAKAMDALFRLQYNTADQFLANGHAAEGIATLARVVRDHPEEASATERLLSALRHRSFALPIKHASSRDEVAIARINSAGTRLFTVSPEGNVRLWDFVSERLLWGPVALGGRPVNAEFGPAGAHLAICTDDKKIHVLNAETGMTATQPAEHDHSILGLWFSRDGRRLVSGDTGGHAKLWNAEDGSTTTLDVHPESWVQWCDFSRDGTRLVTCSRTRSDFKVQIWDTANGDRLLVLEDFEEVVQCARFSRDGRTLTTASNDRTIRFYDTTTGEETRTPITHPRNEGFFRVQYNEDETRLLTVTIGEFGARIFDAATGKPVGKPMLHENRVYHAQWSPDGDQVLTTSWDRTVRVWDAETTELLVEPIRPNGKVQVAEFIPEADRILTTSSSGALMFWDIRAGREEAITMPHQDSLYAARFSPDGNRVLSNSSDGTAGLWDALSGRALTDPLEAFTDDMRYVFDACFNSDGSRALTASSDGRARVWDTQTGEVVLILEVASRESGRAKTDGVRTACFSPDDKVIATGSHDGMVGLWDARTGERLIDPIPATPDTTGGWTVVWTIQFSADGSKILTSGTDGAARLWDARTGAPIGQPMKHTDDAASAWFSPDERRILTASRDGTARQWDASTCQQVGPSLKHDDDVNSAFYSHDGRFILTASNDGTARLWDAASGEPVFAPMDHQGAVLMARFDTDSRRIVTASADGTARTWDARLGLPTSESIRHPGPVNDARFNGDGSRLLTASSGSAHLWMLPPPLEASTHPAWLPDWAEAVASLRFTENQVPEFVTPDEFFAVRERITGSVESDLPTRLAKWFFLDRSQRPRFLGASF